MDKKWWILRGIKFLVLVALAIIVFGHVTMYLWNWLIPDLFHGPVLNIWQTYGLLVLCKILFGGFHSKGRQFKRRAEIKMQARMEEKWATMSPEERDKAREAFRNRCGGWAARWQQPQADQKHFE